MDSRRSSSKLVAIILAAGQGTRLFGPGGGSKALFRYGGQHLIDYALRSVKAAQIVDIALVAREDDQELRRAYKTYTQLPPTGSGTIGAVADAARYALEREADAVIASCDLVCDKDAVGNLLRGHRENPGWEATFGITRLANDASPIWVHHRSDGTITDYGKGIEPSACAFASIRVATTLFLRRMLDAIAENHPDVSTDTTLMRRLIVTDRVRAGAVEIGNAIDIDDKEDIVLAAGMNSLPDGEAT